MVFNNNTLFGAFFFFENIKTFPSFVTETFDYYKFVRSDRQRLMLLTSWFYIFGNKKKKSLAMQKHSNRIHILKWKSFLSVTDQSAHWKKKEMACRMQFKSVSLEKQSKKKKILPASWPALLGNSSCLSGPDMLTALFKRTKRYSCAQ